GRWHLIRFRETNRGRVSRGLPPLEIGTAELPNGGTPIVTISTRAAAVYVDGVRMGEPVDVDLQDGSTVTLPAGTAWGVLFQAFLASEEYNAQIIADADGLPPNPAFTQSDAYLRPATDATLGIYPETEHEIHGPHLEAAQTIAVPESLSPFILFADIEREEGSYRSRYMSQPQISGFEDPRVAMDRAAEAIRAQIKENLAQNPELQAEYDLRLKDQAEIDRLKAEGKPIPARLIRNPFYLYYYEREGMLEGSTADGGRTVVEAVTPVQTTAVEMDVAPPAVEAPVDEPAESPAVPAPTVVETRKQPTEAETTPIPAPATTRPATQAATRSAA
ncbi:MAG: hypothetical protein AAF561_05810, partial [Planctomycetota bacterium]